MCGWNVRSFAMVTLTVTHLTQFVRIQPGSMLQLLYPCSRYNVDKCVLCGGTFRDHLTLWWSKHLYTPYDRYLDQVYHDSVTKTPTNAARSSHGKRRKSRSYVDNSDDESAVEFGYHRQYVLDITTLLDNIQKPSNKAKELHRTIQQRYHTSTVPLHTGMNINAMEQRTWPRFSKQSKIKYIVPRNNVNVHKTINNDSSPPAQPSSTTTVRRPSISFILWFARDICLDAIDQLLDIQNRERIK